MHRRRTNFVLGFSIGILFALLLTTLAVLFIPDLRAIVGLSPAANTTTTNETTVTNNSANTVSTVPTQEERPVVVTESDNISVTSPAPYTSVGNPMTVTGSARVFESTVSIRLLDGDGTVLAESIAMTEAADVGLFGPFTLQLPYDQNESEQGTLEVFQASAADGSEIDKVTIPILFGQ